jgi:hypothetical protein
MPAFNWSFTGLLNGDAPGVVTGSPLMTTTANAGSPAGTYPITATVGTLAAANYAFDIRTATLTVVPAVLTVAANNLTIQYGSSIPTLTATISGFVNGDLGGSVVGGVPALSTTATGSSGAGTYPITVATGSLKAANYSFRFVNGTLTITKAVASVTPANATMTYGGPLPAFALAFSGFVHGDTAATAITGNPVAKSEANAMSKPGSYALTALAGSMASKNYSFVFGTAQITVNKAKLSIVANDCSIKTGNNLPKLSFTATGLVKGETLASATTGAPQLSTPASAKAKPGSYPIVAASGTLAASDYQIVYSNGTLTVTP